MRNYFYIRLLLYVLVLFFGVLTPIFVMGQHAVSEEQQDFLFAEKLYSDGMFDLAASKFMQYAKDYPLSLRAPEALLRAGESFAQLKSYDQAHSTFRELFLRFPKSAVVDKAQFNSGECLQNLDRHQEAGIAFERVYIFTPESELAPVALYRSGQEFLKAADLRRAENAVFLLIENYPTSPYRFKARYVLAQIHLQNENLKLALQELEKINGEKPDDVLALKALQLKAEIHEKMGRFLESEAVYGEIIDSGAHSPIVAKSALHMAEISLRRGEHDQAKEFIDKGLKSTKNGLIRHRLLCIQGDNLFAQGDHHNAVKVLSNISPDSVSTLDRALISFRLGVINEKINNKMPAIAQYKMAIALCDTIESAQSIVKHAVLKLADVLSANGQAAEAAALLHQQQRKGYTEAWRAEIWYKLGKIRWQFLSDYSGAIRAFTMLLESFPESELVDQAQFEIARCHEQRNEHQRAVEEYKTLIRKFPGSELAETARKRIEFIDKFVSKESANVNQQITTLLTKSALGGLDRISTLQLADLNFEIFRKYEIALELYRQALASGSILGVNLDEIAFKMAMCHKALAEKGALDGDIETVHSHSDSVTKIYEILIHRSPQREWVAKANKELVEATLLNITNVENRATLLDTLYHKMSQEVKWDSLRPWIPAQLAGSLYEIGNSKGNGSLIRRSVQLCDTVLNSRIQGVNAANIRYLRGQAMISLGNDVKAAKDLEIFVNNYPQNALISKASFQLARLKLTLGDTDGARNLLQTISEKFYYTHFADSARLWLCKILSRQEKYGEAVDCLEKLNSDIPSKLWLYVDNPGWDEQQWALGRAYKMVGSNTQAEHVYRYFVKSCTNCPSKAKALWELAYLAQDRKAQDIALERYLELEEQFPSDTLGLEASVRAADLLYEKGQWVKAWDKYDKARNKVSGDLLKHSSSRAVLCAYKMGDFNTAEAGFKRFKNNFDDRSALAEMLYEKGSYLLKQKKFGLAEKAFKELTNTYKDVPEGARGELGLGRMYVILNKTDEALKVLTGIPVKYSDPKVVSKAYISLGDFYYQNRQLENAIFAFKKVLDLKVDGSERASALRYLIRCYDDVHLWDRAVALAREYVELYPDADDVFAKKVQIGVFMLNLKEYERGIAYLADLKRQADRETEAEIQYWIGKAYLDMGRFEEAIAELLKVKYLCPPTKLPWAITAVYESGRAYQRLGRYNEAKKLFEQVVREEGAESRFGRVARERIQEMDKEMAGGSS